VSNQAETKTEPKPVPQCDYIKFNGLRCGCPALKGHSTCYFHTIALQRRANPRSMPFPLLEDRFAIQSAIMHVIDLYTARQIAYHDVHIYLRLLSLAVRNGRDLDFDSKEARAGMVTAAQHRPAASQPAPEPQAASQNNAQPKPPQSAPAPRPAAQNPGQHPAQNQRQKANQTSSQTNSNNGARQPSPHASQNNASQNNAQPAPPSLVDALAIAERLLKNAS
jgi:hypothetical protein